jgi:replication factor C subunit 3/5
VYSTNNNSGSSNKDDIVVKQSNYHIIIEPQNNNSDRYLIQDIVKEYAKKKLLFKSKKNFKVVLINNIDNLSYHAQTSLRRTMEVYSDNCRFIMWSTSLSSILEPLRSRCNIFNVNRPSFDEQYIFLLQICYKEKIRYDYDFLMNIISRGNGNIKKLLWSLELTKLDIPIEGRHEQLVNSITKMLVSTDINNLTHITDMIYDLIITNITPTNIMTDILLALLNHKKISDKSKIKITEIVADHEHNLIRGRRDIIHMESMMINIMHTLYRDKQNI